MSTRSLTRYGEVGTPLARAARFAIATIATPALIILDDVHLRLSVAYTSAGVPPVARPTDRWAELMQDLFRFGHCPQHGDAWFGPDDLPVWAPAAQGVRGQLARADDTERRALGHLFAAGGSVLLAMEMGLSEQVELAGRVHRRPRPFALVPTDTVDRLRSVGTVSMLLVRHAEPDTLDRLLPVGADIVKWARAAAEGQLGPLPGRYFDTR